MVRDYEVSFDGAVDVGETNPASAARELVEELGVTPPVRHMFTYGKAP
jgi:8-oxo-dGTP pyrophosphatase MutT (NUDIX family)